MKKRLAKSQKNKMLTGTLAGIAEYYDIDPTIVRVLYIFISIVLVGAPILLYILLMLIIPKADAKKDHGQNYKKQSKKSRKQAKASEEDVWSDF
ncbi:PspC domain-containing protein [Enterococcus gilvus]|jgi:phage shock protein PspC (stress-responsive transcriptional regulator)|uniref:PspC domain-containing protein n=1 Tax=Enterococcus gilvus TaxID=160453 RepID=UPI003D6C0A22